MEEHLAKILEIYTHSEIIGVIKEYDPIQHYLNVTYPIVPQKEELLVHLYRNFGNYGNEIIVVWDTKNDKLKAQLMSLHEDIRSITYI